MRIIEQFREWLSIELLRLSISVCPYEEMRELIRASITIAVGYTLEGEDESN